MANNTETENTALNCVNVTLSLSKKEEKTTFHITWEHGDLKN